MLYWEKKMMKDKQNSFKLINSSMIVIWSPCQHRQLEIHIEKTNKTKQKYLQKKDFQEKKVSISANGLG
jgi:hypothetical protein